MMDISKEYEEKLITASKVHHSMLPWVNDAINNCRNKDDIKKVVEKAFQTGALWQRQQSPWISVEDDLPCNHAELVNEEKSQVTNMPIFVTQYVLVYWSNGIWGINRMYKNRESTWIWAVRGTCFGDEYKVIAWMPAPEYKKGGKGEKDT